jgi:acetoin utilization deacetylase AcuC-like enzyme
LKSLLLTHPDCNRHELAQHPERPQRLKAVMDRLQQSGLASEMQQQLADEVSLDTLALVHRGPFIDQILASEPATGVVRLDPDTYMSPGSGRAARLAAGAVVDATRQIISGTYQRAFCAIRPPGHHAEVARAMGFCLFNNVAVAAASALLDHRIERVAILDFDVHHCNGSVDIFRNDERVLICSSFQDNYYPYRYLDFCNNHVVTSPLPAGADGDLFRQVIGQGWLPALQAHKPDLIFVSAGFDAHRDDPLASLSLLEDDYIWVTRMIRDVADRFAGGRIVSSLEGGYDLTSLAGSAEAHVRALIE